MGRARLLPTPTTLAGLVLAMALPAAAAAQAPPAAAPGLPRFDAAGYIVWLGAETRDLPGAVYRTWDATGGGALGGGFYWTEHVKLEVDVGVSEERVLYGSRTLESSPNGYRHLYTSHYAASRTVSLTTVYQALHNTWVHPFVGGGVDVDWERRRTEAEIRSYAASPAGSTSNVELLPDETSHARRVQAALVAGAKFYVSRRAFVRTDVRLSFSSQIDAVRWRAGAGFDF